MRQILQTIDAGLAYLPPAMNSPEARAMLLAIGLQESRFVHRRQIRGPARGFWQFEVGGCQGVLTHQATRPPALAAIRDLRYGDQGLSAARAHELVEHNDLLAVVFARLNLWWAPGALPKAGEHQRAWEYYLNTWRPGKPHRQTWDDFYTKAWGIA